MSSITNQNSKSPNASATKPRVVILVPTMISTGGTERVVSNLANCLANNYEVFVCSFDPIHSKPSFPLNVNFAPLGRVNELRWPLRPLTYLRQSRLLSHFKSSKCIDLTISNLWRADLISWLSGGKDRKIAVCHINVLGNPSNKLLNIFRVFTGWIYRRLDLVVAVSEPLLAELRDVYQLAPDKSIAVENAVIVKSASTNTSSQMRRRLVWCGRFVKEKNPDALIPIFKEVASRKPDVQLVMIGDGPLKSEVLRSIAGAGLSVGHDPLDQESSVVVTGRLSDPIDVMRTGTLFLLPSRAEGLPLVLLEALTLGLPIVGADCDGGGVRSIFKKASDSNRPMGLLLSVPEATSPGTFDAWVDGIDSLLDNQTAINNMRSNALVISRQYSPSAWKTRWLSVVNSVLNFDVSTKTG